MNNAAKDRFMVQKYVKCKRIFGKNIAAHDAIILGLGIFTALCGHF